MANKKSARNNAKKTRQVINSATPFAVTEAYKSIRTNLMFMLSDRDNKWVAVTSSNVGEGKTTTCANLALTFAQTGAKTLIIDGDMRKPQIHKTFSTPTSPGLSDMLGGFCDIREGVYATDIENLYVVPAGTIPPNPAELLASHEMQDVLECFTQKFGFEYIFLDTPPINIVTDVAAAARNMSGVLMVTRANDTVSAEVKAAVSALEQAGISILGFILNSVKAEKYSYRYKRKYGKSYYSKYGYKYSYKYGYSDK